MMKLFLIELRKTRRRHVGMLFAAAYLLIPVWDLWSIGSVRPERNFLQGQTYEYLLLDIPLQNAIFLPIVIAAAASRLCDIELKGSALKMLCTMEKRIDIYRTKLTLGALYLLAYSLAQAATIPALARYAEASLQMPAEKMPTDYIVLLFLSTFTVSMTIFVIQTTLSLFSASQLIPLFIGVGGSFFGLFTGFLPQLPLRYLLPWGYYWVFASANVYYIPQTRDVTYYLIPFPTAVFAGFAIFGVLVCIVGRRLFMGREV